MFTVCPNKRIHIKVYHIIFDTFQIRWQSRKYPIRDKIRKHKQIWGQNSSFPTSSYWRSMHFSPYSSSYYKLLTQPGDYLNFPFASSIKSWVYVLSVTANRREKLGFIMVENPLTHSRHCCFIASERGIYLTHGFLVYKFPLNTRYVPFLKGLPRLLSQTFVIDAHPILLCGSISPFPTRLPTLTDYPNVLVSFKLCHPIFYQYKRRNRIPLGVNIA